MDVKLVKAFWGKTVYYDTGQMNFEGCRRGGRAAKTRTIFKRKQGGYFPAFLCVRNWMQRHVAQAELTDPTCKKSVYIVPLEKVMRANET